LPKRLLIFSIFFLSSFIFLKGSVLAASYSAGYFSIINEGKKSTIRISSFVFKIGDYTLSSSDLPEVRLAPISGSTDQQTYDFEYVGAGYFGVMGNLEIKPGEKKRFQLYIDPALTTKKDLISNLKNTPLKIIRVDYSIITQNKSTYKTKTIDNVSFSINEIVNAIISNSPSTNDSIPKENNSSGTPGEFKIVGVTNKSQIDWDRQYIKYIINSYGFTAEAEKHYLDKVSFQIVNKYSPTCSGEGYFSPGDYRVYVGCALHEGTVHEMSHAWWQNIRGNDTERVSLVQDMLKLAAMDENDPNNKLYIQAIEFAKLYRDGNSGWGGMFCGYNISDRNDKDRCAPVKNSYTDEELKYYTKDGIVLDHEIFAGFSSWTMGQLSNGPHQLPPFFTKHFTQFKDKINIIPYYEAGGEKSNIPL